MDKIFAKINPREIFEKWLFAKLFKNSSAMLEITLTVVKPLHAKWLFKLYDKLASDKRKDIIISGWRAACILDAVQMGSVCLQCLDPFQYIDPVDTFSEIPESTLLFPEDGNDDVNKRYYSDSDDEYVLDEERNAFDALMDQTPSNM